ncbi:MAG TPA: nucleotide sugar dehydrogenase [Gemmatimonadaceae bacterium]|nr:nucleotide sugar dehydrogenase [Gemmatimonadaceae bacterium]
MAAKSSAATSSKQVLLDRFHDRSAVLGVIGLGYVGLPLAVEFAKAGFHVIGYDVSQRVVDLLNAGDSHIQDVPASEVAALVRGGKFEATSDETRLSETDAISIAVPTPLGKTRDPDMSYVIAAADATTRQVHAGMLVILESTTYPGTTREVLLPALTNRGFTVGKDVFVAFSPERVDPGNPVYHTKNTPKVVGGVTPNCTELATALYGSCIDQVVPVSSPEAAELTKLLENTFRSVNIGLVNEMAIVCDKLGVDVWEVIDAAATKPFGFMKFTPGPGIGGHCIPLDPHYLAWKMRTLNYKTRFIDLASEINSHMPAFVVEKVAHALNQDRKPINGSKVLVLGVAYKRDIDDVRESPALDVIRLLEEQGGAVTFHDPFIRCIREDGHTREGVDLTAARLDACDAVVIVTDHRGVDYQLVMDHAPLIVDSRNITAGLVKTRARVVTLSAGQAPVPS